VSVRDDRNGGNIQTHGKRYSREIHQLGSTVGDGGGGLGVSVEGVVAGTLLGDAPTGCADRKQLETAGVLPVVGGVGKNPFWRGNTSVRRLETAVGGVGV